MLESPLRTKVSFKDTGASGVVTNVVPMLKLDEVETPYALIAISFTYTALPQLR